MLGAHDSLIEYHTHFKWAVILVVLAFLLIGARLFQLQIVDGDHYESLANVSHVVRDRILPTRGTVTDRNGVLLATDVEVSDLMVIPHYVSEPEAVVERLMELGVLSPSEAASLLERLISACQDQHRFHQLVAKRNLVGSRCPYDLAPLTFDESDGRMVCSKCGRSFVDQKAVVQSHLHEFTGFSLRSRMVRYYPERTLAVHAVGYVNEVTAEEVAKPDLNFRPGDVVGRTGIERALDDVLRGVPGEDVYIRNASGRRLGQEELPEQFADIEAIPPKAGQDVLLTIDVTLQRVAEEALKPHNSGAVVALDINTGEVLVMASEPSFTAGPRLVPAEHNEMELEQDYAPMMNKALSAFPPASTFKMITAMAGLMEGAIDEGTEVNCPGFYSVGGRKFHCFQRHGHGDVDLVSSLGQSCDTYFYVLGETLGIDNLAHYGRDVFGLGEPTGIEIREHVGHMPTERWYLTHRQAYQPGYAINAAVGQGDVKATPLAMARAYAAIVNGGRLLRPHLVKGFKDPETGNYQEIPTETQRNLNLPQEYVDLIKQGLFRVVNSEDGTAYNARIVELPFAGKTGTAQARERRKGVSEKVAKWLEGDHAWFVGYAPARRPQVVVVAFVEHGGFGGLIAATVARKVIAAYYREHADEFADLWEGFESDAVLELIPQEEFEE